MIVAFLVALIFIVIISLIVFGGGQVFIPLFRWLWEFLNQIFNAEISPEKIDSVIAVANSTPGVVSTKFGFITGYLLFSGSWAGWIAMFITFLFFTLPAIFITFWAYKKIMHNNKSELSQKIIIYTRPVLSAIMLSLALQLFIEILAPFLDFNKGWMNYWVINFNNDKSQFFSNWRYIVLLIWIPLNIILTMYFYNKKVPIFVLLGSSIIVSLIVFQPWL
ncbi:chromate transporter [Candidatus Mycoplasma pogonae]